MLIFLKAKNYKLKAVRGQLLLEALLAIAVGSVILGLGAQIIYVSLRGNNIVSERAAALGFLDEAMENVRAVAFENWMNLYKPPDGTGSETSTKGFSSGPDAIFSADE